MADKEVTAAELLALARERCAAVNPTINAVVAQLTERRGRAGGGPGPRRSLRRRAVPGEGPRAGVRRLPDVQRLAGPWPHDVATEHALVTQRFLDAGLVVFGKTNTPEFGAKGVTEPELWGAARNPWNTGHTPGGSSGGSGAAVAAGIVPAAGANDGGGSVRIPAACNGLVGLKTSRGVGPYGPQTGEVMFGMVTQGVRLPHRARQRRPAGRDHRSRPGRRLPGAPCRRRRSPRSITRPPGHAADRLLVLVGDQRPPGPRGGRRGRGRRGPAQRARSPGRGGRAAVRRRGAGPGLPHHLVRPALRPGHRREAAARLARQPLRGRHAGGRGARAGGRACARCSSP